MDDGSTDKTGEICDQRVKVIYKENGGLVSARKAGVFCATGEYVTYVDSDDWIDLDRIERMVIAATETGADLIYGTFKPEYPNLKLSIKPVGVLEGVYKGEKYIELIENIMDTNKFYTNRLFLSLCAFYFEQKL